MRGKAGDDLVSYDFTERWQSGRMCRIRNPVYRKVPGVRIPLSPLGFRLSANDATLEFAGVTSSDTLRRNSAVNAH
jgi:hypothetical protein